MRTAVYFRILEGFPLINLHKFMKCMTNFANQTSTEAIILLAATLWEENI
jgi:hypothetical protein